MAKILGVGIATLDIINKVESYPAEDSEVRALSQQQRRGGNVTNTLVVLSQLQHHCSWAGSLGDDTASQRIHADLAKYAIEASGIETIAGGITPVSYITLSEANGSRSIVHYRDLPEYSASAFQQLDLSPFDWLHFEGRNVGAVRTMLNHARDVVAEAPRSLEIEKPRQDIESLFGQVDVLIYARAYVEFRDGEVSGNPAGFLKARAEEYPSAVHICPWGKQGAYALAGRQCRFAGGQDHVLHQPAMLPASVVDTLAAGDTFNAGVIHAMVSGKGLAAVLVEACALAGKKCGQAGLENLV